MNERISLKELGPLPLDSVRHYLNCHGWRTALSDRAIRCVGPLDDVGDPIVCFLPVTEESREYPLRVEDLLATLSAVEDRPVQQIAKDIFQRTQTPASIQ